MIFVEIFIEILYSVPYGTGQLINYPFTSTDPDKQTKAIGLLSLMNPDLGQQLSNWVK